MFRRDTFLKSTRRPRQAFTLVELMVVIAIISITTVMAVAVVTTTGNHDRVRSSASLVQSALMGGRDRAIRAKAQQGVRFFVDTNNPNAINGFAYIGVPDDYTQGTVSTPDGQTIAGTNTNFFSRLKPLLQSTNIVPLIEVPANSGSWFPIDLGHFKTSVVDDSTSLKLARDYGSHVSGQTNQPYRLRFPPTMLPGQEIQRLSSGIVIDTNRSRVGNPDDAGATLTNQLSNNSFDVLFSPNGGVFGSLAAKGRVFLWLSDTQDQGNNRNPADPAAGEMFLVSLFTQTGHAGTYPIDPTDTTNDSTYNADDPYRFAKSGGVAGR